MAERIDYLIEKDDRMVGDHLLRYWLAAKELKEARFIFDCACGTGYGSELLSNMTGATVFGIDYSQEAIAKCRQDFPSCVFDCEDLNTHLFPKLDEAALVSFETIEHLHHPSNFIKQFPKFQNILLSVPIIKTTHTNKHHLQDFTEQDVLSWFPETIWHINWKRRQHDGVYMIISAVLKKHLKQSSSV